MKLQRLTHLRKLVTFVPPEHLETVRQAMCAAGAEQIGAYTDCTFHVRGTGTFLASEEAHPAVGRRGRLEQIDEYRLEAVVPSRRIEAVVQALVQSHPYEEPAYDIYPLEMYRPHVGHGRIGTLAKAVSAKELVLIVKRSLRVQGLQVYGSTKREVLRVAVGAGSGDALAAAVREKEADVFVTGEMRSHAAEALAASGVIVVTVGHRASETPILSPLTRRLKKKLAGLRLVVVK